MSELEIIIDKTPFLYEDGNTYYFSIHKREFSSAYHNLYVYRKIIQKNIKKPLFSKPVEIITESYEPILNEPMMVSIILRTIDIKDSIERVLMSIRKQPLPIDWDGVVGNIPEDLKRYY